MEATKGSIGPSTVVPTRMLRNKQTLCRMRFRIKRGIWKYLQIEIDIGHDISHKDNDVNMSENAASATCKNQKRKFKYFK